MRGPRSMARFLSDERGNLTMEFMLWLPILLFWFAVSAVFYDAYKSRDDAAKASYTLSDIVSRTNQITLTDLEELVTLQRALLPRAGGTMSLRLSSISCTNDGGCLDTSKTTTGHYAVDWSIVPDQERWPDDFENKPDAVEEKTVPVDILPPLSKGDAIVLVDVTVPFVPFSDWVGIEAQDWVYRIVTWPRFAPRITLSDDVKTQYGINAGST